MPLTVGTAGHIDHGKTTLVEALTGKNTDRLPQERERGISIDLGYAPLELPDGTQLSVVDVPGHERFVRTMVAGATGIDLFLLVIDANEGARPQTHEHLAVLRLLGIERGVVALTKLDLVDDETLELARAEAEELVPGAPVVAVSARSGAGLDELRAAIAAVAKGRTRADAPTRLYVDRVFTLRGIGTVATGTLWSGSHGERARAGHSRRRSLRAVAARGARRHGAWRPRRAACRDDRRRRPCDRPGAAAARERRAHGARRARRDRRDRARAGAQRVATTSRRARRGRAGGRLGLLTRMARRATRRPGAPTGSGRSARPWNHAAVRAVVARGRSVAGARAPRRQALPSRRHCRARRSCRSGGRPRGDARPRAGQGRGRNPRPLHGGAGTAGPRRRRLCRVGRGLQRGARQARRRVRVGGADRARTVPRPAGCGP